MRVWIERRAEREVVVVGPRRSLLSVLPIAVGVIFGTVPVAGLLTEPLHPEEVPLVVPFMAVWMAIAAFLVLSGLWGFGGVEELRVVEGGIEVRRFFFGAALGRAVVRGPIRFILETPRRRGQLVRVRLLRLVGPTESSKVWGFLTPREATETVQQITKIRERLTSPYRAAA